MYNYPWSATKDRKYDKWFNVQINNYMGTA